MMLTFLMIFQLREKNLRVGGGKFEKNLYKEWSYFAYWYHGPPTYEFFVHRQYIKDYSLEEVDKAYILLRTKARTSMQIKTRPNNTPQSKHHNNPGHETKPPNPSTDSIECRCTVIYGARAMEGDA